MEKLTARSKSGDAFYPKCFESSCFGRSYEDALSKFDVAIYEKLAAYEEAAPLEWVQECTQALKEGRLLILPYKLGERVVCLADKQEGQSTCLLENAVAGYAYSTTGVYVRLHTDWYGRQAIYGIAGQTVFPDIAAAKAALEEEEQAHA